MSIASILWALDTAQLNNPTEVSVLLVLADAAWEDGTNACPAIATVARRARVSSRTVHRTLRELEARGVIRRGDQSVARRYGRSAPIVYDLDQGEVSRETSPGDEGPPSGDNQPTSVEKPVDGEG